VRDSGAVETADTRKYLPPDMDPGEEELLLAAAAYVQEHFPNPDRVGCPGTETLRRVAADPKNSAALEIIKHTSQCAPCLSELRELIHQARRR
jgi:hypothetical protein